MRGNPKKDIAGQRFGRLIAIRSDGKDGKKRTLWAVRCDCGNETRVTVSHLLNGHTRSCGCLKRDEVRQRRVLAATHGHARQFKKTAEYRCWNAVLRRTAYASNEKYRYYGGRGIKVCDRWRNSFDAFLADMGPHPGPGYSIERLDANGDYAPDNCVWATKEEQARNRRCNKLNTEAVKVIRHLAPKRRGMGALLARLHSVSTSVTSEIANRKAWA